MRTANERTLLRKLTKVTLLGDDRLFISALAAFGAGERLAKRSFAQGTRKKEDHHSLETEADVELQKFILCKLHKRFPQAYFLAEESIPDKKLSSMILTDENFRQHLSDLVFGVDPLDGTVQYYQDLYEYSVSIGIMDGGVHRGGIIYAPEIKDGFLIFGLKGKGVYLLRKDQEIQSATTARDKPFHNTFVLFGIDIPKFAPFLKFLHLVANKVQTANVVNSCAMGLALVASGRVDALIQPLQKPWDWFAGYPLIEEAGGKIQFYQFYGKGNAKIELLDKPQSNHYSPTEKSLGFIAGNSKAVDKLMLWLIENYSREV